MRVLVIESDKDTNDVLVEFLASFNNIEPYHAETAKEAKKLLREKYDLILLDYYTYQTFELKDADFKFRTILLTTAWPSTLADWGPTSAIKTVLKKPFNLSEIEMLIAQ